DLVLTSPPYGGTYDYLAHHARRHAWLGINPKQLREGEIGARRDLSAGKGRGRGEHWDRQIVETLGAMRALMHEESLAVLLVGDAEVGGRRMAADRQLERLAPEAELEFVAAASSPRPDWRGGPPRKEHLVALRVP
ncbi:MAG: hypothetical protein KC431_12275, partial [Myxococcales bacterium]|nr:hypothetical protein [Myxococcales bacterium]